MEGAFRQTVYLVARNKKKLDSFNMSEEGNMKNC